MTKKETEVIISLIDMFQFDSADWTLEGINLGELKKKLLEGIK